MYNYHTGLILKIDIILFIILGLLAITTIIYTLIKEYAWKRRSRELLNIKRNVYELTLSGQKIDNQVYLPIVSEITPQQFLDVTTNRIRDAVFFNEAEQRIFKHCFVSQTRVEKIEKRARSSWNKWRRIEAILSLGYAHADSCLRTLEKSINNRDKDIAYFSIISLGQIRIVSSAKILLDFLRRHRLYYYKIFSVLEAFPVEITDEVISLCDDADPQIRAWAIKLISKLKPKHYLEKIEKLAQDKSEEVRAAVCDCLGELSSSAAKDTLVKCLSDDFWLVRVHAIKALSQVLGEACLTEIISRINDPSLSVIDSLKAVIAEHIEAALPYLEKFLFGNDEIARRVSIEVLGVSGYILKVFKDILSGSGQEKSRALRLLEGLIISRAHFGIKGALMSFTSQEREKLLGLMRSINKEITAHIEKNIAGEINESL